MPVTLTDPQRRACDAVQTTARNVTRATRIRDGRIVEAHRDGAPLAAIARAADLDRGTVRRILADAEHAEATQPA